MNASTMLYAACPEDRSVHSGVRRVGDSAPLSEFSGSAAYG